MRWGQVASFTLSIAGAGVLGFAVGIVTSLAHVRWHASDVAQVVSFTTATAVAVALLVQLGAWLPLRWELVLDALAGAAGGWVWWTLFGAPWPAAACAICGAGVVALFGWRWRLGAQRWAATHVPPYPDASSE